MPRIVDWPSDLTKRLNKFAKDNPQKYPHPRVAMIEAVARFINTPEPEVFQMVARARRQAINKKEDTTRKTRSINKDTELLRQVRAKLTNGQPITDINALKAALGLDD